MRIDNVKLMADHSTDPDEVADNIQLLRLFLFFRFYLEDQQKLPFIREEVRQLKGLDPTAVQSRDVAEMLVALGRSPSVSARQEEAELKLGCAERGIRDFHHNLPWWHEIYTMTNARIKARAAKSVPITAAAAPPDPPAPEPTYGDWDDTAIEETFPRSAARQAFARAIVSKRKKDGKALCEWIDENSNVDLPESWTPKPKELAPEDKNARPSFELAYRYNKHLIDDTIAIVWNRMLNGAASRVH
jgi:hypothetical protein